MVHSRVDSGLRAIFAVSHTVVLLLLLGGTLSAQTLPAPWAVSDIGFPTVSGSATFSSGSFSVTAAGADIGGQQDQFTLVQQKLTGDGTIIARVRSPQRDSESKAGVMMRSSLDAASTNVFAMITGGRAVSLQRRRVSGGDSVRTDSGTSTTVWLKIERRSSVFTAFQSSDGVAWREIATEIIAMPGTIYVGLALTSHRELAPITDVFSNVSVTATAALPQPPTLPQGWSNIDIGLPALTGSASESSGVFAATGGGTGIDGSADQFNYTYRRVTGDLDIVSRVKAVQYVDAATIGGLMVRDSLTPNGAYGSISMRAGGGVSFQQRASAGDPSSDTVSGALITPYWLKLQVRNGVVTAFGSSSGTSWTQVGTVSLTLPSTFYVGLSVTSADPLSRASAIFDNLAVNATTAQNQAPTISLTAPDPAASYTAPAQLAITADAADADGTISGVDFFQGSTLLGAASAAPYSYVWNSVPAGTYTITAVAHDNEGATTTSGPRTITVSPSSIPAAKPLPSGWSSTDIGAPTIAGSTQYANGTFTVQGTGIVWSTSDQFRYVYQQFSGDVTITSHVASVQNTSEWTKAGVMLRESLTADAAHTSLVVTSGHGTMFFQRTTTGSATQGTVPGGGAAPFWVRLERRGTVVTAYQSSDGTTWTAVGTATMASSTMYVGMMVSSEDVSGTQSATGVFDNVTVSTPTSNQAPTVSLTAPANGATYTAPATVTLTATASDSDGSIARVDFFAGANVIGGAIAAPYSFTWTNVAAGTYALTAVARDNAGASTTSAVQSITVNAPANQAPTVSLTAPANGATYTAPASIGLAASASDSDGTIARVDFYAGATLIGSATAAPYGFTWTNVAAGTYALTAVARDNAGATTTSAARSVTVNGPANQAPTISLTAPANGATYTAPASIGLAASASDSDGTIARVDFYAGATLLGSVTTSPYTFTWMNVAAGTYSLTAVARDNAGAATTSGARSITVAGSVVLPAGWTSSDIGGQTVTGSAQYAGATFTLKGAGVLWGTADQFHFAYQQFTGDITITSRVVSLENTSPWAKAGVMVRETLAADSNNTSLVLTPGNGAMFFHRDTTGQPPQGLTTGTGAPAWVRLQRRGTLVTAFFSSDGLSWTSVGTSTMTTPTMYVGLAVSSEDSTRTATGVFDNVTVSTPTPNQPPTVSLTAPANGSTYTAPASFALTASASDTDGSITTVDFYANGTLLGSASAAPYSYTWSNVAAGSYTLAAVAHDSGGGSTTSVTRTVTVNPAANQAPTVSLTAPANGATYAAPASIGLTASATDTDGSITKVDFYANGTLLGSASAAPYSYTWSNVAAGSYTFAAVAHDSGGASTTSATRTVTVNPSANQAPTVSLTAPANGASYTALAIVTVSAAASDADGSIAKVDFYAGTTLIGSDTSSPYGATWINVAAGNYSLTAVATDNSGATRTSAAVAITVTSALPPPTSRHAVFTASSDHNTLVVRYVFEIFRTGADPNTATPVATQDLGKPAVVNGECDVDITATVNALASGSYIATVSAVGNGGSSRSAAASFTR